MQRYVISLKYQKVIPFILKYEIIILFLHRIVCFIMTQKNVAISITIIGLLFVLTYLLLYNRWKHLWALETPRAVYTIKHQIDDTLRVVMIGDSWAGMHHEGGLDTLLFHQLRILIDSPLKVVSSGRGGEKSRGIYRLMFEDGQFGTRPLLSESPDYCIVIAGINDAAANMGAKQYCYHYRLILDFLLLNHVRPVVIEIPNVNIGYIYRRKPIKDLFADYLKSKMVGCNLYDYNDYREAFLKMLNDCQFMSRIVFVPIKDWNEDGVSINRKLFLEDQIHLNRKGYELLDSCIAARIANDYNNR